MTREDIGPGGLPTAPAQSRLYSGPFYSYPRWTVKSVNAELRLISVGWRRPAELAVVADALNLLLSDFEDRLAGVVTGYLRLCGEKAERPTLSGAEAALDAFAVIRNSDELFSILISTSNADGDSVADLVQDVLRGSHERDAALCMALTRDAWRAMIRGLRCPHCNPLAAAPRRDTRQPSNVRRAAYV